MKYRILSLLGLMALTAGSLVQAQDYDDIYYDASKAKTTTKVKVEKPAKTIAVYGEVPDEYKVIAQGNYQLERDEDEYNRRGAYDPEYEIDINGDTIYEDAFANTRRIERFYNPDIVILSDDDELVELYYDESPTINLIVGSDWGYSSYGWAGSYYPWYTGWYEPWYSDWYSPWYYGWYSPWRYGWGRPVYYGYWHSPYYGWWSYSWYNHWGWGHHHDWGWPGNNGNHYADWGKHRPAIDRHSSGGFGSGRRAGLASNRNTRTRVDGGGGRSSIASRGGSTSRSSNVGTSGSSRRSGYASSRSGNMGSRTSSGISSRNSGISRSSSSGSYRGSSSRGSYSGSSSNSSSRSGSSRSSGSYSSGSSHSSGSYSSGSSRSSGSSGGGSHGGSSGGGGRRR
jgi:hypothetical protein